MQNVSQPDKHGSKDRLRAGTAWPSLASRAQADVRHEELNTILGKLELGSSKGEGTLSGGAVAIRFRGGLLRWLGWNPLGVCADDGHDDTISL